MTTKKTTKRATTTKKKAEPVAATERGSTEAVSTEPMTAPKKATRAAASQRYTLQLGTGFTLLTRLVEGGALTASRVPAGATIAVSYWKEPNHPQHPTEKLARVTMHSRLDGVAQPSLVLAERNAAGELLRLAPEVTVAESAKLLEYWFELETDGGHTLWDSNWGNNHWLELAPATVTQPTMEPARAEA